MNKKHWLPIIPLILIAIAITFSPEFTVATIEGGRKIVIRFEDLLLMFFAIIWILTFCLSGQCKIKKPPLFLPIILWLGISCFTVLLNWILGNITLMRGFFYLLKETEFFLLYFYVYYHLKDDRSVKIMLNTWLIIGISAFLLILYQFLAKFRYGTYGPSLYQELGPLPSGGFFLLLFTYLFNIFLYRFLPSNISRVKKIALALLIFSLITGIISSGSRASFYGLIFSLFLTFIFFILKTKQCLKPLLIGTTAVIIFVISYLLIFPRMYRLTPSTINLTSFLGAASSRSGIWREQIKALPSAPINLIFGSGKSVLLAGEESHNQYVRNFIETGIIGSLIFLMLLLTIVLKSGEHFLKETNPLAVALSSACCINTITLLFTGLTAEVFLVVRAMMIYWFLAGLTMALLTLKGLLPNTISTTK